MARTAQEGSKKGSKNDPFLTLPVINSQIWGPQTPKNDPFWDPFLTPLDRSGTVLVRRGHFKRDFEGFWDWSGQDLSGPAQDLSKRGQK